MKRQSLSIGIAVSTLALAGVALTPPAWAADDPMTVSISRTDSVGSPVYAGEQITSRITVQRVSDDSFTAFPRSSSMQGVAVKDTSRPCRWSPLGDKNAKNCDFGVHVITADDVDKGSFTPTVTFDATRDRDGNDVIKAGITASAEAIPVARSITAKLERTDQLGNTVDVGDRLTFRLTYTNSSRANVTAFPRSSNLSDMYVKGEEKSCRWANLKPKQEAHCDFGYHVITEKDMQAGTFTPEVVLEATKERAGTTVLNKGEKLTTDTVTVNHKPHPSESVQDIVIGQPRVLAGPGTAGYACQRIPALTTAPNGWLLAAWDGRPDGCRDAPQPNSIISRISKDGGKSWSTIKTIAQGTQGPGQVGYSDPSFVVDRETNKVFAFMVKSFDQGIAGSHAGIDPTDRNVIHTVVVTSEDNGETWSEPRVITADITPNPQGVAFRFAASGEGIQLKYGPKKGRLIQQYTIKELPSGVWKAMSVYSDDHGATWKAGTPGGEFMDENKVVELSDGTLLMNSRTSNGALTRRLTMISRDQGESWQDLTTTDLIDPRNNASIIRACPSAPEGSAAAKVLLFSNTKTERGRHDGHIRVSTDDGKTWSDGKLFQAGAMQYSTLTPLPEAGHYGLFYEKGNPIDMAYMEIDLNWLGLDPNLCSVPETDSTDPVDTADTGTQTDPTETSDQGAQTDPVDTADTGSQTDPADTADMGTQTDPVDAGDKETPTDPVGKDDNATQTDPVDANNKGTQTDPVDTNNKGTQTDPTDKDDKGTQTDPVVTDTKPGVTPAPQAKAAPARAGQLAKTGVSAALWAVAAAGLIGSGALMRRR